MADKKQNLEFDIRLSLKVEELLRGVAQSSKALKNLGDTASEVTRIIQYLAKTESIGLGAAKDLVISKLREAKTAQSILSKHKEISSMPIGMRTAYDSRFMSKVYPNLESYKNLASILPVNQGMVNPLISELRYKVGALERESGKVLEESEAYKRYESLKDAGIASQSMERLGIYFRGRTPVNSNLEKALSSVFSITRPSSTVSSPISAYLDDSKTRLEAYVKFISDMSRVASVSFREVGEALKDVVTSRITDRGKIITSPYFSLKEINNAVRYLELQEKGFQKSSKESQQFAKKSSEVEVRRAEAEYARMRKEEEEKILADRERSLALSNREEQELRDLLDVTHKLAMEDAKRLETKAAQTAAGQTPSSGNPYLYGKLNDVGPFQNPIDYLRRDVQSLPKMLSADDIAAQIERLRELNPSFTMAEIGREMRKAGISADLVSAGMGKIAAASKPAGIGMKNAAREAKNFDKSLGGAIQRFKFWDTALGTMAAMSTFLVLQTIQQFFSDSLAQASKFRESLIKLNFSEAILSKKGMDITRDELDSFVQDLSSKFQFLSKQEASTIVSDTFGMLDEFDVSKENMKGLSEAIAFIQLSQRLAGEAPADAGSILNAAMDARSNYFNKLGVNISEALVKEKAYQMGLAKTGSEIDKQARSQAVIALLIEQTAGKTEDLISAIRETSPAMATQLEVNKKYEDSLLEIGNSMLDVKDAIFNFLDALMDSGATDGILKVFVMVFEVLAQIITSISDIIRLTSEWVKYAESLNSPTKYVLLYILAMVNPVAKIILLFKYLPKILMGVAGLLAGIIGYVAAFFTTFAATGNWKFAGEVASKAFKEGWDKGMYYGDNPGELFSEKGKKFDTPTAAGTIAGMVEGQTQEESEKISAAFADLKSKIEEESKKLEQDKQEIKIDLDVKLGEIDIDYARKVEDIIRKYNEKIQDIDIDYGRNLEDIELDFANRRAELIENRQKEEYDAEREYQERLLKLREKYLMDLEDALHERDARQVLKLMKQYEIDKRQAAREHANDKASRERDFRFELSKLQREKEARLEEARREHEQRIEEANLAKKRELEDANRWREQERADALRDYQRKMNDLMRHYRDRLSALANELMAEYNLTSRQAAALHQMLLGNLSAYDSYVRAILSSNAAAVSQITATASSSGFSGASASSSRTASSSSTAFNLGGTPTATISTPIGNVGIDDNFGNGIGRIFGGLVNWFNGLFGFAEGGTMIADKPTTVTFGERGLEAASFIPLSRAGKNVNNVYNASGNQIGSLFGGGGTFSIEVRLSDGLEERIVENSLSRAANAMYKVTRSKK